MAIIAVDNFERADGGLGPNWSTHPSFVAPQIIGGQAVPQAIAGVGSTAFFSAASWPNDQYSEVTVGDTLATTNHVTMAIARLHPTLLTCYAVRVKGPLGPTAAWQLRKVVAGTTTILIADTTISLAFGDRVRLEVVGNTLSVRLNDALMGTLIDASVTSGNAGFLMSAGTGLVTDAKIGAWSGGDFSGVTGGYMSNASYM